MRGSLYLCLLWVFFVQNLVFALDGPHCQPPPEQKKSDSFSPFINFISNPSNLNLPSSSCQSSDLASDRSSSFLPSHVARAVDPDAAFCKTKNAPSLIFIKTYLDNIKRPSSISEVVINGVSLSDSAELLDVFRLLTNVKNSDYTQKIFTLSPGCKDVTCAVKEIWGEEMGLKLLYIAHRFKIPASEYVANGSRARWEPDELDDVLVALEDLPQSFYENLKKLDEDNKFSKVLPKELTHYNRSYDSGAIAGNASIYFYNTWDKESAVARQVAVTHELGHNFSFMAKGNKNLDATPEWKSFSNWGENGESSHPKNCISEYAQTDAGEDFAESVCAYRYLPKDLYSEKYEFIKNEVFKGIEFTSDEGCLDQNKNELEKVASLLTSDTNIEEWEINKSNFSCVFKIYSGAPSLTLKESENYSTCVAKDLKEFRYQQDEKMLEENKILSLMKAKNIPFHQINYEKIREYARAIQDKKYEDLASSEKNKKMMEDLEKNIKGDTVNYLLENKIKIPKGNQQFSPMELCRNTYKDIPLSKEAACFQSPSIIPSDLCPKEKNMIINSCYELINRKISFKKDDLENVFFKDRP